MKNRGKGGGDFFNYSFEIFIIAHPTLKKDKVRQERIYVHVAENHAVGWSSLGYGVFLVLSIARLGCGNERKLLVFLGNNIACQSGGFAVFTGGGNYNSVDALGE